VVDGHLLLSGGPIYGSHLTKANTGGTWKWIRQDLRKDLTWEGGRVVHVEYAAIEGAVSVAETVACPEQPRRNDPPLPAAVNRRLAEPGFDWNAPAARLAVDEAVAVAAARDAILADVKLESATAPAIPGPTPAPQGPRQARGRQARQPAHSRPPPGPAPS
jgi:hypothetical protein